MTLTAVLYTDGNQECDRVRMLLRSLGGEFLEYGLGEHFTERQFFNEFGSDATFPQVTIDGRHIGSLKETLQFFQAQEVL